MTLEERLKDMILARYGTLKDFVPYTGLSYSTVDTILRRGVANAGVQNVIRICHALHISADELANGRIIPVDQVPPPRTGMTDIAQIVAFTKRNIAEYDDLTIDGKRLDQSEITTLLTALEIGLGIIRANREKK